MTKKEIRALIKKWRQDYEKHKTAEASAHAQALYAEQQVKYFEALLNAGEVGK